MTLILTMRLNIGGSVALLEVNDSVVIPGGGISLSVVNEICQVPLQPNTMQFYPRETFPVVRLRTLFLHSIRRPGLNFLQ